MATALDLPREERLRTGRPSTALALSAWRGTSGRRYVVGIHPVGSIAAEELLDAVVIAVRRNGDGFSAGIAKAVRVTSCPDLASAQAFLSGLPKPVTELHVHRLSADAVERAAVVEDLSEGAGA